MRNTGAACSLTLYRDPQFQSRFLQIWLSDRPGNGEVAIDNPTVRYTPKPGFQGEDRFIIDTIPEGRLVVTVRVLAAD
jgi:hypothetical protein